VGFGGIICAEEVGEAKEHQAFWEISKKYSLSTKKKRTLLADEHRQVLQSARRYGIRNLIHVARPSSRSAGKIFPGIPFITTFQELILLGNFSIIRPVRPAIRRKQLSRFSVATTICQVIMQAGYIIRDVDPDIGI